jgi:hypothetical protein
MLNLGTMALLYWLHEEHREVEENWLGFGVVGWARRRDSVEV